MAQRVSNYSRRRSAVSSCLHEAGADALLVTSPGNVRYLTGFTGTNGWFVLGPGGHAFITDPRYEEQARAEVGDARVQISSRGLERGLASLLEQDPIQRIGFESHVVTVALREKLTTVEGVSWVPCDRPVEAIRRAKDAGEVEAIERSLAVAEAALSEVATGIVPGQTETEIAAALEYACRRRGAEGMAFETIVASGPRSALPHGVATQRVVARDEPVMIDMGCRLDGYCSDITRMVWCGPSPNPEWLQRHELVDRAREAAMDVVRAGVTAESVDAAARGMIADAGLGEAFSHGTGHGVGLEIHEAPTLSGRGTDRLEDGMVVTIEPAVYLQGSFGIRIEDMVQVRADGYRRLTTLDTDPILPKIP